MKRKVVIVPYAGLANRMRAIASGVFIAKELQCDAEIYWKKTSDCHAVFADLFMPVDSGSVHMIDVEGFSFFMDPPSKRNGGMPPLLRRAIYAKEINNFNRKDGDIFERIPSKGSVYLSSCHSMSEHYPLTELFVPVVEIQARIDQVKRQISGQTIGIHIRRNDNLKSIAKTGVDDFKRRIDAELEKNRLVNFYLATDSMRVKDELKSAYGNKIITYEASLRRDTTEGMKDAVVDLWSLSSTVCIIGSYYSSYSELAAEMGNGKLIII